MAETIQDANAELARVSIKHYHGRNRKALIAGWETDTAGKVFPNGTYGGGGQGN